VLRVKPLLALYFNTLISWSDPPLRGGRVTVRQPSWPGRSIEQPGRLAVLRSRASQGSPTPRNYSSFYSIGHCSKKPSFSMPNFIPVSM